MYNKRQLHEQPDVGFGGDASQQLAFESCELSGLSALGLKKIEIAKQNTY